MHVSRLLPLCVLLFLALGSWAQAGDLPRLEFEKYVLDNGLQVILHEDHSIPLVGVNIWYHVGSKNELPGRTGFAHLFEHMMFQGSENHDDDYFVPLKKIGAFVNGSTTEDRTNYMENVPADQVELALFLESDRMGYLLPALTDEKFENQKDVVRNEKREYQNQPYSISEEMMLKLLYPSEHPYSWTVIGSMEDLTAASKEDVSEFFRLFYAPNNASLCVTGDFDPVEVKELIARYFGPIPPGRPVDRLEVWQPVLTEERRARAEDAVELPRLYMAWHSPGYYEPGDAECDLLTRILGGGKTSRLYKTLVYEQQIAQDVTVRQDSRELSSIFQIEVTAAPGHDLEEIEAAVDRELAALLKKGVGKKELELARTNFEANFIRGLERIGGFGGKADRLNRYNTFTGDPGYLGKDLARFRDANVKTVNTVARQVLDLDRRAVLHIVPQGVLTQTGERIETAGLPGSSGPVSFTPPDIQTATLDNGMKLYLVEKHDLPLIQVNLNILSGWSADPAGKPGTASLTADMLDEGAKGMSALEISEQIEALGARLGTGSFFDGSQVMLNVLKNQLESGLDLMSRVVLAPTFPQAEFDRIKKSYLGRHQQENSQPMTQAIKELQKRIFGKGHPYAQPITGTGTEASLAALTTEDLARFHETWYRPNNTGVVVVGDLTLAEAKTALEKAFAKWEGKSLPAITVPAIQSSTGSKVVVIDRPGSPQSAVVGGYSSMGPSHPDYNDFQVMNLAFGGQFTCRINMNLREDKGYTYGVRSQLLALRDGGMFLVTAPVQTQFTKESLFELQKELTEIRTTRPLVGDELQDARNGLVMGFPSGFESMRGIAGQLGSLVRNSVPLDEWRVYTDRVRNCTAQDIAAVVENHIRPEGMIWIIVGDWAEIEPGLRELDLGDIEVIRAEQS